MMWGVKNVNVGALSVEKRAIRVEGRRETR